MFTCSQPRGLNEAAATFRHGRSVAVLFKASTRWKMDLPTCCFLVRIVEFTWILWMRYMFTALAAVLLCGYDMFTALAAVLLSFCGDGSHICSLGLQAADQLIPDQCLHLRALAGWHSLSCFKLDEMLLYNTHVWSCMPAKAHGYPVCADRYRYLFCLLIPYYSHIYGFTTRRIDRHGVLCL